MCPGGVVVGAAASEEGGVVTNGMSLYRRDSGIANSALVVNVTADDMGGARHRWRDRISSAAMKNWPMKPAVALSRARLRRWIIPQPSWIRGRSGPIHPTVPASSGRDSHEVLPGFVTTTLEQALPYFAGGFMDLTIRCRHDGRRNPDQCPGTDCPGEDRMALAAAALSHRGRSRICCGIKSAFLDGLETAIEIIRKYQPLRENKWQDCLELMSTRHSK